MREKIESLKKELLDIDKEMDASEEELTKLMEKRELLYNEFKDKKAELANTAFNYMSNELKNFKFTGDKFKDNIKKANLFCDNLLVSCIYRYKYNDCYRRVYIYKGKIIASDGRRLIMIDHISPETKNDKSFYIDIDEKSEIEKIDKEFLNSLANTLKEAYISINNDYYKEKQTLTLEEFKDAFYKDSIITDDGTKARIIKYGDVTMGFNEYYLESGLFSFKEYADDNPEITVYLPNSNLTSIILENDYQKVLILPLRLRTNYLNELEG